MERLPQSPLEAALEAAAGNWDTCTIDITFEISAVELAVLSMNLGLEIMDSGEGVTFLRNRSNLNLELFKAHLRAWFENIPEMTVVFQKNAPKISDELKADFARFAIDTHAKLPTFKIGFEGRDYSALDLIAEVENETPLGIRMAEDFQANQEVELREALKRLVERIAEIDPIGEE